MASSKILLTGATGFIGGSVLSQFLTSSHPKIKDSSITAIVRKKEQAEVLEHHGVKSILFNGLDDTKQLREIASQLDIVVHSATGLHTPSAEALILGLGDSMKKSGRQAHYIHTTGTSNLAYGTLSHPNAVIRDFSDTDDVYGEEVRRASEQHYDQRATDLIVIKTSEATGVIPYLMMPPTVYGRGTGFFNRQSMQVPFTINTAIDQGHPEYIGDGSGFVGYVHISDLAPLYEIVLGKVLDGGSLPSGRKGIYFSNTGEYTWKALNEYVGEIGVKLGALSSATPSSVGLEHAVEKWGSFGDTLTMETNLAGRSRTTPKLAFQLGWAPTKTEKDWYNEIEESFKAVLTDREKKA